MKDILRSVTVACDSRADQSARQEAFAELVRRFQDMAFACAYASLGDAYLAEDIAQESFVIAWQKLNQLREPKAFPGWFKRIVLNQCKRITRRKHLQLVSLHLGTPSASKEPDPEVLAEKHELLDKVFREIRALPDHERLVTTLFYVDGYTQSDISEFLEVRVTTVNKRLYTARQRLKEKVEVFSDNFKTKRPSRDHHFSERVSTRLRLLVDADWLPIKSLAFAREEDPLGNDLWLQQRQNFDAGKYVSRRYVVDGPNEELLAFGSIEQTPYLPKYRLLMVADPQLLGAGVGDLLLERLIRDLHEVKAVTVLCREYASQTQLLKFLLARGFKEIDRVMDLRLDLAAADVSQLQSAVTKIRKRNLTITTLAEERIRNPGYARELHDLTSRLSMAEGAVVAPPAYNEREALLWLKMPYVIPDACFIAKKGDRYVGLGDVNSFQALPGGLTHGFTGVLPEYRRQGVATALKLSAIQYAKQHNYKLLQSFNRSSQPAAVSLNQKLGFELVSSNVTLEKCLRQVVEVEPGIYDEYAGHYRDDAHQSELELIVRNEAGRLTLELAGQKVELFPTSASEFFVKPFYGEVTFARNANGQVDLLKLSEPASRLRKASLHHARRID